MAKGDTNPSLSLDTLFPTLSDESFLQFLKDYYRFLQSTKLTLTGVSGTFVKGEVITGADSRATGVVFSVGTNEIIVVMSTEKPLDSTETITGSTSGATATVATVKDNVIRESARLKDSRSQYVSGDEFFQLLKDELNRGYPSTSESDRRLLYNRIRDLLQSKSTEEAYRFLFKAFFDENIEIRFPGDDILRVSDGKFEKTSLIRVIPTNTNPFPVGEIFDFLNKTIRGQTSGAVGTVVNISISFLGGVQFAEFNLKLVSGEFEAGETVADVLQPRLSTEVFGVIGDIRIIDGGSGYSVGDQLTITGDGAEATAEVSSISTGPINRIIVNTPGYGYRLNTRASVDNTDTAGNGLAIIVSSIANTYTITDGSNTYTVGDTTNIQISSRGSGYQRTPDITLVDTTIQALGLLSERLITITDSGNNYAVGETLTFTGGAGTNAAGEVASVGNTAPYGEDNLLFEDDFVLLQEQEVNGLKSAIKSEDWTNTGPILRIELTNLGSGYTSANLPVLTLESANTVSGANASFTVNNIQGVSANVTVDIANNSVGIGSIRQIDIRNPGINFSSANVNATTIGDGNANLEAIISGLNVNRGFFTNDDGKINFKIIQDSFFYQDFSYVIRSGLIIDAYKELVKETVHPAGLEFFGEIVITSIIGLQAEFRSQIDQTPRPLALSSFLSLYPVGVTFPYAGSIREVEITPEVIDQALVGVTDFNIREIEITPVVIETLSNFEQDSIDNIKLYLPRVDLAVNIDDVKTDVGIGDQFYEVTIQNYANSVIFTYSANTFFDSTGFIEEFFFKRIDNQGLEIDINLFANVALQIVFNDVEIAETSISEVLLKVELDTTSVPVSVRDFNLREIEIVKNIDVSLEVDQVKTFDTIADQYGETPISFFTLSQIQTFATNTFLDSTGFSTTLYKKRPDVQGFEVEIELQSSDLQADVVPSTSFGTESEVPLFISVSLIDTEIAELVNRLELYVDVSSEIVYNDVQILETAISDVVIQIFSIAQDTLRYSDILISQLASEQISEYASTSFRDTFIVPLNPARTYREVEIDIELPLVTVAATITPFRIFVDRLRIPALGIGISVIDATINFEGTSYEIDVRPDSIFSTLQVIPQNTGRVKTLRYFVPPLTATIPNIYEVIKIQPELDLAPIPRMKLEIDVPVGFASPFKAEFKDVELGQYASEQISLLSESTFEDVGTIYRYESMSKTDIDYRIEIYQFIDSRMRFYSEILTMTNREMTVELEVFSGPVDVATKHGRTVTVNYFSFGDVPLQDFASETISAYASTTFATPPGISFTREVPSTFYELDIEPVRSQVVSLFIPTVEHLGNTERQIELYIDSRMRFYSEILTMTNREMTVELEVFSGPVDVAPIFKPKLEIDIPVYPRTIIGEEKLDAYIEELLSNYELSTFNDSVNRNAVRLNTASEVIKYLELAAVDLRMAFYSEIYTMTNRVHTTEIEIQSGPVNVAASTIRIVTFGIDNYGEAPISLFASNTIAEFNGITSDSNVIKSDSSTVTADEYPITFNTPVNLTGTKEIPSSFYKIDILPSKENVVGAFVSIEDRLTGMEKEITLYADLRMAFYSEIYTMTNRVHTTEIEIQSGTSVIAIPRQKLELDIAPNPRTIIGQEDVAPYADELITNYASSTFNDSVNRNAISLNTTLEVVNFIELDSLDSRMRFYTEVLTMTNREMTVEIDVILEKIDVSTTHNKLETINYYQYADVPIVNYASETIASFANTTLNENPGVSFSREIPLSSYDIEILSFENVLPNFSINITPYGDEPIATFANEQIQTFATFTFDLEYSNLNISKNVLIDGTVTFIEPGFADLTIGKLAPKQIVSYSANVFTDLSGSNTSVIGTNTSFTTAFTVGGTLITPTEKFLITSIANNEYLEVNVNPEENYNDASIYREYFV